MKLKTIIGTFMLAAFVVATSTVSVNAVEKKEITQKCYVDANKNNLCDKFENKSCKAGNGSGASDCIPPKPKKDVAPAGTKTTDTKTTEAKPVAKK